MKLYLATFFSKFVLLFNFIVFLFLLPYLNHSQAFSGNGSGALGDPYQITNCTQLQEMQDELSASYILMNDIDCSETISWNGGEGFLPVGDAGIGELFIGNFDGQGYIISDLYQNRPTKIFGGLFGVIYNTTPVVKNFGLVNVDITASRIVGAIAGEAGEGMTENCFATGTVNSIGDTGGGLFGMIGHNAGSYIVNNCYSEVDVTCGDHTCGGFVGAYENPASQITNSYSSGNVAGTDRVGGFMGNVFGGGPLINSFTVSNVTGTGTNVGGFDGFFEWGGGCTNTYYSNSMSVDGCGSTKEADPAVFYSSDHNVYDSNSPYWDFASVWQIQDNDYPKLLSFLDEEPDIPTEITLLFPDNEYSTTSNFLNINYEVSGNIPISCSLYLNENLFQTVNDLESGAHTFIIANLTPGRYSWYISCIDSDSGVATTAARTFTINTPAVLVNTGVNEIILLIIAMFLITAGMQTIINFQISKKVIDSKYSAY